MVELRWSSLPGTRRCVSPKPLRRPPAMTTIKQEDLIRSVADALQYISLLPPGRLHRGARRGLRGRGVAGGEGRDRADPDQLAHVRRRPSADLPGHRHRRRVRARSAWTCAGTARRWASTDMVNEGVRRAYLDPDNTLRASIVADPAGARKNTKDNTPAVVHIELVPGQHGRRAASRPRAAARRTSRSSRCSIRRDSIVDWVLKTVPTMGAGWCPPGMLGIGIGGTRGEGDAAGQGSADGADRHARAEAARPAEPASRSCASSSTTRSTRSASARRAWAA